VSQESSPTTPVIPDFELLRLIGQGSYGDVWLARGITGLYRAVKVVWRDRFENAEPFEREFRGLRDFASFSLKAEGQMALLHIGRNDAMGFFYYVMELADDANQRQTFDPAAYVPLTLKEWRARKGRVPAPEVIAAGAELANALAALHVTGLVHRDIKPSNAILVNGKAKLADIGLVAFAHEARTFIGTMGYVPPEGPGSPAADVFALGRVLYELATGRDQEEFPKLPEGLERDPDRKELFALNEVLLRACAPADGGRYHDARGLAADLVALRDGHSLPRVRSRRWQAWAIAAVVGGGAFAAWHWLGPRPAEPVAAAKPVPAVVSNQSIAVLPFENLSGGTGNVYLADGIQEDLVTDLASIRALKVVSRSSTLRYRGTTKTMKQVGTELGVAFILSGSIRREGDLVRVTAQLIDARTDAQVWAKRFDRQVTQVLALQSDLAGEITPALQLTLNPEEQATLANAPTTSEAAYDLFLRARALSEGGFYNERSAAERAEKMLRQATTEDPRFVRAWVELAIVHADRYFNFSADRGPARRAMADDAIEAARRLAPKAPEVLVGLGLVRHYAYRDYAGAMHYYQMVVDGYPNYPGVRTPLALLYRRTGHWAEALAQFREAVAQEPGNRRDPSLLISTLAMVRRLDEVYDLIQVHLRQAPDDPNFRWGLAVQTFRRDGSRREYERWMSELTPDRRESPEIVGYRLEWALAVGDEPLVRELAAKHGFPADQMEAALVLFRFGDKASAADSLKRIKAELDHDLETDPKDARTWVSLAKYHALAGDRVETRHAIDRARELVPEDSDAIEGPTLAIELTKALVWVGEKDAALADLERLIKLPATVPVWILRHSVAWQPLRGEPRFEAILADPKNSEPLF